MSNASIEQLRDGSTSMDPSMDALMDGWMDGEDLIICVALWTLYTRRPLSRCDDFRTISIASRNKLRSASLCGAIFRDFGAILKRLGRPKWMPKPIFWRLLFDVFFECVFAWIFGCFLEARNLKNHEKPLVFQWFLLVFTKSTFTKK